MANNTANNLHPWLSIWVKPRATMRKILDTNPLSAIIWFAIIWGVISGFSMINHMWNRYTEHPEFRSVLYAASFLIGGAIFGIIFLYFAGWLYKLTGSWIGGKGTFTQVKCAVGWAYYPFIISTIFGLLVLLFIGFPWLVTVLGFLQLATLVWGFVIFLNLLAEAHNFSVWRALGAVLIAYVLVFIVLMILGLLTPLLTPFFHR